MWTILPKLPNPQQNSHTASVRKNSLDANVAELAFPVLSFVNASARNRLEESS